MTKRCVAYARLSVSKEESVSIDRQLEAARNLAALRGWDLVGEYVDDGVSATANRPENRAGWKSLLDADFHVVIIWKVDRIARRVLDFLHVDDVLQKRGAALVAVEDPIDMTTPMGRAFATILAVFGEMEAAAIASRVRAARDYIVRDGRWPGGEAPYGYQPTDNPAGAGKILARDPHRIHWLTQIVEKAQGGMPINGIATWLTSQGAPPPRLSEKRVAASGKRYQWNRQTIDGILRNPTLAGMTPRNPGRGRSGGGTPTAAVLRDEDGQPVIRPDLAIMSVSEWDRLQKLLNDRNAASPQGRNRENRQHTNCFLARVVTCGHCNRHMYRGTNAKNPVLSCPQCRQTISRTHLDPLVTDRLLTERGDAQCGTVTVTEAWGRAGTRDTARRDVLRSQLTSLTITRGKTGAFDPTRVHITWKGHST